MPKNAPCVVDTNVIHHANQGLAMSEIAAKRRLSKRLQLLQEIRRGSRELLISRKLTDEYRTHLRPPFNDFVRAFLEIALGSTAQVVMSWTQLSGSDRDHALKRCRFPPGGSLPIEDGVPTRCSHRNL